MKKRSYVTLQRNMMLYFLFLFSSSVMQSLFSFPMSFLFGTQQNLTHPPVESSTLPIRKTAVFQGPARWYTIFTSSCVIPLWDSATAHSPSGKELNSSSGRCPFFRALLLGIQFFISSCVIPLWDSATAHSPSGKELNPSSQEDARFSGRCTSAYNFHFILRHPSLVLSNSSLTLR